MDVTIPDHFAPNIGGAMVERAARIIKEQGMIPAYLYHYEVSWNAGLRFGGSSDSFWEAVGNYDKSLRPKLVGM